ncbi:Hypothetical protein FKW44_017576, partial [Caligus rogercresseyi]
LSGGGGAAEDGHVAPELLDACGLPAKGLRVPCGVQDFHFLLMLKLCGASGRYSFESLYDLSFVVLEVLDIQAN